MLVEIVRHFRCDWCSLDAYVKLFPPRWCWVKPERGEPIRHACEVCRGQVPADRQREAGQKT